MPVIANVIFFKVVWAASLAGVVIGYAWLGLALLTGFIAFHARTAPTARADFLLAAVAVAVGFVLDTLYIQAGLIAYEGELLWSGVAPLWILTLWFNFALTMNGCLRWMQQRKWLAAGLGYVFGPIGYVGGIALGTARATGPEWILYTAIGIGWALALPLLLWLAARFAATFAEPVPAGNDAAVRA